MPSKVYFIDNRATIKENFIAKIGRLVQTAGLSAVIDERDLTAVKLHFGVSRKDGRIHPGRSQEQSREDALHQFHHRRLAGVRLLCDQ